MFDIYKFEKHSVLFLLENDIRSNINGFLISFVIMKTRTVLHILIFFVCLSGCIYHINYINNQYFAYKTITRVLSKWQDINHYPQIVWCTLLLDMVKPNDLVYYNISTSDDLFQFSIHKLFDMTPAENRTMKSCWLRGFSQNAHVYQRYSPHNCYDYFSVVKYISATSVCYIIHPNKLYNYSIYNVANALTHGMDVFRIDLSEEFNNGKEINMLATYTRSLTLLRSFPFSSSRRFGEVFLRNKNETRLILRPFLENYHFLPPPYDTMCSSKTYFCRTDCVTKKTTSRINLFPFSEATHDYQDMHILSSKNLKNFSLFQKWKKIEKECGAMCSKTPCSISITSNVVYKYNNPSEKNYIEITLSILAMYPKIIMSVAAMFFVEWVSSISTSLSIWFGISVLSFGSWNCRLSRFKLCFCTNKFSKYVRWVYWFFCAAGFLFQFSSITHDYFQYHTRSNTEVSFDDKHQYPSVGFCMYKDNLFEIQGMASYNGHYNLTSRMIFEYTPGIQDIISGCSLPDEFSFRLNDYSRKYCLNFFTISKALRGSFVCYTFTPKNFLTSSYSWTQVASAFRQKRQLYTVWLSINIKPHFMMVVMSYFSIWFPTRSRCFAQKITPGLNNLVYISMHLNKMNALPSPYETKCIEKYDQEMCNGKCLRPYLASLGRLPYSQSISNSSLNVKILDVNDLENVSVAQFVENAQITCAEECSGVPCFQSVALSDTSISYEPESNVSLKLISLGLNKPPVLTVTVPATRLIDFFLYICNCFGIWFGFSFLSMNSFKLRVDFMRIKSKIFALYPKIPQIKHRKCMKSLLVVICFIGFVWQEYTLALAYFKYQTMNRIEMSDTDIFPLPNIVFCPKYREVIPVQTWQLFLETNSVDNGPSIKQILTMTPNADETILECSMRFNGSETWSYTKAETCSSYFAVVKFVFGGHICYKFAPKTFESYSLIKVTSALSHVGIIYEIFLNDSLSSSRHLAFIYYSHSVRSIGDFKSRFPVLSRKHLALVVRDETYPLNYFIVQGVIYNFTLLEAPYDTHCTTDRSAEFCESQCNIRLQRERLQRVPFREMTTDLSDLNMVSENDLKNETISKEFLQITDECSNKCLYRRCATYYTLTDVGGYLKSSIDHDRIVLAAGVPKSNGLIIRTFPLMFLIDFLNNVAVSAVIWLGVSMLSLLMIPVKVYFLWKDRNKINPRGRLRRRHRIQGLQRRATLGPQSFYLYRKRVR